METKTETFTVIVDSCCEAAKRQGMDNGHWGGVVCCDGNKSTCVWRNDDGSSGSGIIQHCLEVHEQTHLDDIVCTTAAVCGPERPGYDTTGKNAKTEECEAYTAELQCLEAGISDCDSLPTQAERDACRATVQNVIDDRRIKVRDLCGP
jgi:hypothetical protein